MAPPSRSSEATAAKERSASAAAMRPSPKRSRRWSRMIRMGHSSCSSSLVSPQAGRHQLLDFLAQQILAWIAKELFHLGIHQNDSSLLVHDDELRPAAFYSRDPAAVMEPIRPTALKRTSVNGRAVLDPKPGACEYCHAVSVCRISDRGIDVAAELRTLEFDGVAKP